MKITKAEFITSVVRKEDILNYDMPEFAFVGRSNVGKSSFINSLINQIKLVKTSSTPGHTRMINYFKINSDIIFVDLPGYGYAKASKQHQETWSTLIGDYLLNSQQLKLVFLIVDARHEPSDLDKQMQKFLFFNHIPYIVVANKIDKIAKSKIPKYLQVVANNLSLGIGNVIGYSCETHSNRDKVLEVVEKFLKEQN